MGDVRLCNSTVRRLGCQSDFGHYDTLFLRTIFARLSLHRKFAHFLHSLYGGTPS